MVYRGTPMMSCRFTPIRWRVVEIERCGNGGGMSGSGKHGG